MTNKRALPYVYKLIAGIVFLAGMFVISIMLGAADISLQDVWAAITFSSVNKDILIIQEIRLPREIGAALVGAAFGVSGAVMQGVTRNPLADPGLLGLTSGATAALAITLAFAPNLSYMGITIACFIGSAVGAILVIILSSAGRRKMSPFRIVLAGAAISTFLIAVSEGIGLYFKISKFVSMWTAGGLIGTTWAQITLIAPIVIIGIIISIIFSKQLTILSLNEEVAIGLGQSLTRVRVILFIIVILLTGASVALVGNLAFIGLMIPHIVRSFTGTDYRYIVPMSAVLGAAFMLIADTMGRLINVPYETPVVAVVSMLGLPFFLFVVHKGGKSLS
ncbi:iron ABC transporter permease [Paenibacillus sp. GSMTC-2017]|uniref:FecCD family ABC transporter permease n=1 Tax=Paenibacillus sp. GSMTC-2017 TaxID=2794350 RepID=UPI0018D5B238|nr:iron ABC transporter permease [Paenibacillus sp. GSMTC-2017]MBH5318289.1 iron ABC transporter permease [Paenibacillus sp. GSMTC-2017]